MNFEPQKFFIGLVDFFSILLPGALLTYVLKDSLGPLFLGDSYYPLRSGEAWVVFLFSSYLLGHFVFLVGSQVDRLYEVIRNATDDGQKRRLAKGECLSPALARWLAAHLFKKNVDAPVNQAAKIKGRYLDPLGASSAINAFQWCKARLTLEYSEAMATVQRFEADSKFFRSLLVVLCVLIPWGLSGKRPALGIACLPLLVLAFWRYVDQRVKSTNQAYWYIITLEAGRNGASREQSSPQVYRASHAGGVVFRCGGRQVECLLVQAKHAPQEWVLPKGHVELGERMQEAAVREVREETGVWARVTRELDTIKYVVEDEPVRVQFYLMEALEEGRSGDGRECLWLPMEEALRRATYDETRSLLTMAEKKRVAT